MQICIGDELADKGVRTVKMTKSFGHALARVLFSKAREVEGA